MGGLKRARVRTTRQARRLMQSARSLMFEAGADAQRAWADSVNALGFWSRVLLAASVLRGRLQ